MPAWRLYLAVAIGGALGGGCRYLLGLALLGSGLPWATLLANCMGSLLIGGYVALPTQSRWAREPIHLFVTAGFCGGFTTFSLFSLETLSLLQQDWQSGLLWASASVLLWLIFVSLGYRAGKFFSRS
ncbi:MAG: CrcB family protein [Alcanivoracaceae bacterium]|nr:CrcB family protein [Alcanivoracaceae bacterium]